MKDKAKLLELFQAVAELEVAHFTAEQIARAHNLETTTVRKIQESEAYKEILAPLESQKLEDAKDISEGWNVVESLSLEVLIKGLQQSQDPDLALRAAAMANKAVRPSRPEHNIPSGNATGVVALNFIFAKQFANGIESIIEGEASGDKKTIDVEFEMDDTPEITDERRKIVDLMPIDDLNNLFSSHSLLGENEEQTCVNADVVIQ